MNHNHIVKTGDTLSLAMCTHRYLGQSGMGVVFTMHNCHMAASTKGTDHLGVT